jgi:hypothetical protein
LKDRASVLGLVEQTLRKDFDERGLIHKDVAWRNIGLYKKGKGKGMMAVVFDMTSVTENSQNDNMWVESALRSLRIKSVC